MLGGPNFILNEEETVSRKNGVHRASQSPAVAAEPEPLDGNAVIGQRAADVPPEQLAPGVEMDDLVAWNEEQKLFTRLPLTNDFGPEKMRQMSATMPADRVTTAASVPVIDSDEVSYSFPASPSVASPAGLSPANARRYAALQKFVRDKFVEFATSGGYGHMAFILPFESGDARDIIDRSEKRYRI